MSRSEALRQQFECIGIQINREIIALYDLSVNNEILKSAVEIFLHTNICQFSKTPLFQFAFLENCVTV